MVSDDLKLALKTIDAKTDEIDDLYSYVDGSPALKYSQERLQRAFDTSSVYFAQNWASVIINSVLDRLVLKGFDANNDSINSKMDKIFTDLHLNLEAQDVHESLQVAGEGYLIVDNTDTGVEVYFNDARMCEMFYDADKPKKKSFAAKKWMVSDGTYRLNLYYADRTEKYSSSKGNTAQSFSLMESVPNKTGVIPVFHFKNSRRIIKGELDASTISILDAINQIFSNMMASSEFDTYPIRIFISQQDPGNIDMGPDMKMWMALNESGGEDTKVIELGGRDLKRFSDAINELANNLAVQTNTPRHYFMATQAPSGESLLVMESSLVKKIQKKQEAYSPEWQDAMAYILSLSGTNVNANELVPVWQPIASELPLTNAQVMKTASEAGIPIITSARRMGWNEDEVAQLESDLSNTQDTNVPDNNTTV